MTNKLSDIEKALLILDKADEKLTECKAELRQLHETLFELNSAFENTSKLLKRCLNEKENKWNIHKNCEYYDSEKDYCSNYMMGKYMGLAFEVSRHSECIKDLVKK